jgi:hypothetical protein
MFNPVRRNRNIGKTQGGRVRDGKAVEKRSRLFTQDIWTRLSEAPHEGFIVLQENPSRDYFHPITETDIRSVLSRLPRRTVRPLKAVLLSRLSARDARRGVEGRRRYQCVVLYAFPRSMEMAWSDGTFSDRAQRHYNIWCSTWCRRNDSTILTWTLEELRRYYLFHLLLHEIGHLNQPPFHSAKRRESYAENFALEWARKWRIIPRHS